jgi:hypothetical protein
LSFIFDMIFTGNCLRTCVHAPMLKNATEVSPELIALMNSELLLITRPIWPRSASSLRNCQPGSMLRSLPPRCIARVSINRPVRLTGNGTQSFPLKRGSSSCSIDSIGLSTRSVR